MDDRDGFTAFWVLTDVAPNIRHPITRTFEVQDGDWRTTMIVDRFTVRDALEQLPDMAVILKKRRLRVYLPVLARNP
jgi:hypothetical protein